MEQTPLVVKNVQVAQKERPVSVCDDNQPKVTQQVQAEPVADVTHMQDVTDTIEHMKLNITVAELAVMISNVANGKTAYIRGLPTSDSPVERILDTTLGSFNDGCHRILDGATDIVGGVLDILFLGRTNRK